MKAFSIVLLIFVILIFVEGRGGVGGGGRGGFGGGRSGGFGGARAASAGRSGGGGGWFSGWFGGGGGKSSAARISTSYGNKVGLGSHTSSSSSLRSGAGSAGKIGYGNKVSLPSDSVGTKTESGSATGKTLNKNTPVGGSGTNGVFVGTYVATHHNRNGYGNSGYSHRNSTKPTDKPIV